MFGCVLLMLSPDSRGESDVTYLISLGALSLRSDKEDIATFLVSVEGCGRSDLLAIRGFAFFVPALDLWVTFRF